MSLASPRVDDKRGQDIEYVTRAFKFQPTRYSCYTNCIYNILHELSRAHNCTAIALSEQAINRLCRSTNRLLGPKLEVVVPNITAELKQWGYIAVERSGQRYPDLTSILKDKETSYPIVGLSYDYLVYREAVRRNGEPIPPDHATIVLCSDETETVIYDPYEGLSKRMQLQRQEQGMPRGTYMLPTARFLSYWEQASDPAWMFWIQHKPPARASAKSPSLESYSES